MEKLTSVPKVKRKGNKVRQKRERETNSVQRFPNYKPVFYSVETLLILMTLLSLTQQTMAYLTNHNQNCYNL